MTLWDGGGTTPTISPTTRPTSPSISVPAGGRPSHRPSLPVSATPTTPPATLPMRSLYNGNTASLVENAIGGSGADTMVGNSADNQLTAGVETIPSTAAGRRYGRLLRQPIRLHRDSERGRKLDVCRSQVERVRRNRHPAQHRIRQVRQWLDRARRPGFGRGHQRYGRERRHRRNPYASRAAPCPAIKTTRSTATVATTFWPASAAPIR